MARLATVLHARSTTRITDVRATAVVMAVLVGLNVADHVLGWSSLWLGPLGAAGLLAIARRAGLSWRELGLARDTWRSGLRWGGGVAGLVAALYLVVALVPATRTALLDERYHLSVPDALVTALVVIPLGTVLLEEVAFRSVLWGLLSRMVSPWLVLTATSLLFGLWHVLAASGSSDNAAIGTAAARLGPFAQAGIVAGTVLFTSAGGAVAGELRRRSGSVLASVGMHWATNALGVLFSLLAWHLTS